MIYEPAVIAVVVFMIFVGVTLGLSFYLGRKAKSSAGYFAAHGQIPWVVNGVAFAGDYLSAASFLGICGMIASFGYDGFLYSIGYLAGWIVALFVIAEPMKRLGKFTFADALDARFGSRGIKLSAGIATLAVSLFYLIPQMVGAGALVRPLLGWPHWFGVVLVGAVVILIVVTAGMVSTTWVQFIKGTLLVIFSGLLTLMLLARGFEVKDGGVDNYHFKKVGPIAQSTIAPGFALPDGALVIAADDGWEKSKFVRAKLGDVVQVYNVVPTEKEGDVVLREAQTYRKSGGQEIVNGQPKGTRKGEPELHPVGFLESLPDGKDKTGALGPLEFFSVLRQSKIVLWGSEEITHTDKSKTKVYFQKPTDGSRVLRPGEHPTFKGIRSADWRDRANFLSLMLALFCGTASLPHILIRYYTVKNEAAARKSTIIGIASIGLFYVLTLYLGLGAMTSGTLDLTDTNMSAPLLAKSINEWLFAIISAIAFTTVLGTVSGLILAASGAVTHDLLTSVVGMEFTEHEQIRVAKFAAVVVGLIAIALGILFEKFNVNYLVGWAFSVAASANLPALVMLLFWPRTTRQGVISSVVVGMTTSLAWILLSGETYTAVYGLAKEASYMPFSQPGIVTIPLSFATLVMVSLATGSKNAANQ
jgi:cation/acetate symporter